MTRASGSLGATCVPMGYGCAVRVAAFTDANGAARPGALTITDTNGVTSVDARNTTNLAPFKGTD